MSGWYLELSRLADIFPLQAVLLRLRGAVVAGAVWYATGYLYSLYTAAEHSMPCHAVRGPEVVRRLAFLPALSVAR